MNKIIQLCLAVLFVTGGCHTHQPFPEAYSAKWKQSTPQERGRMCDMKLMYNYLNGRPKTDVHSFLGAPMSDEEDAYLYDLGTNVYHWTLWVKFDEKGKVIGMFQDD